MKKIGIRLLGILALVCMVCGILSACDTRRNITPDRAVVIVLEDLGDEAKNVSSPHVHSETHEGQECYNVYFSFKGEEWVYVISTYGEILHKGPGGHNH